MALLISLVAAFWLALFFGFHAAQGTSFFDYLRGEYEPLPPDLGTWRELTSGEPDTLQEERLLFDEGSRGFYTRQRRTRDRQSGAILSVEPEVRVPRRRVPR